MTTDMSESELKQLGNKIKATRLERSLTQAAVADKADTSPNYYAQIERGEVNPSYTSSEGFNTPYHFSSNSGFV